MNNNIHQFAKSLGFDLVRIIPANPISDDHFKDWLDHNYQADMEYMERDPSRRSNPQEILPGAKSIICLAMNYYQEADSDRKLKVARYAFGRDYHKVIEKKLKKLRAYIIENSQEVVKLSATQRLTKQDFKLYSDAGPLLERAYHAKAGLGFIGKNTTLITPEYGSWVFLAELITTLELQHDEPTNAPLGSCGSCDRCIKACPTKALTKPYQLDARKCISYQTIENKGSLTVDIQGRAFGCDICQEVCPHNCKAKPTTQEEFKNHIAGPSLDPKEIATLTEEEFAQKFQGSPLKRAGLNNLKRNIKNMLES